MKKTGNVQGWNGLSASKRIGKRRSRLYVSLTFTPLDFEEDITAREDIVNCVGVVYLRMKKSKYPNVKASFMFYAVDQPFANELNKLRMYDYDDFIKMCAKFPAMDFIRRATDISPEYFGVAARNYGVYVPIVFNLVKIERECGGRTSFTTRGVMEAATEIAGHYEANRLAKLAKAQANGGTTE